MPLRRFMSAHPNCRVIRPDVILPGLLFALPAFTCAVASWRTTVAFGTQRWLAMALWLVLAGVAAIPLRHAFQNLREVVTMIKRGHAAIAITDQDVLLIDSVGNTVQVALTRVTRLELEGREARLRTDSDVQGLLYAIAFDLFDGQAPGPSASRFFDTLAPRLRARVPEAVIVRYD